MTADREWGDSPGPSDAELIKECRAGNTEAAGLLFRRHHDAALAYARKLAGSSRADDIAAEAFTKTLAQLGDGKGPDAAFRPYLISAVHNTFVSMIRSDDRYVLVDDPGTLEQEPEEVEEEPFAGLVAEAFAELPERWQVVLWHTLIEGDSLEVTAGHLGVSPAAVGSLSYRARRGLSNVLMAKLAVEGEECLPTRELLRKNPDELSLKQRNALNRHLEVCDNCERLAAVVPAAAPSGVAGLLIAGLVGVGGGAYLALRQPAVAAAAGVAGAGAAGGASGGGAAGGGASGAGASGAGASGGGASGSGGSGAVQPPRPPLSKAWLAAPAGVAVVVLAVLVARALQPPPPETSAPDPGGAPPVVQTSVPRPTTQPPPPPRQSPPPPRQTPPSRSPSTRTTPPRPPEPRPRTTAPTTRAPEPRPTRTAPAEPATSAPPSPTPRPAEPSGGTPAPTTPAPSTPAPSTPAPSTPVPSTPVLPTPTPTPSPTSSPTPPPSPTPTPSPTPSPSRSSLGFLGATHIRPEPGVHRLDVFLIGGTASSVVTAEFDQLVDLRVVSDAIHQPAECEQVGDDKVECRLLRPSRIHRPLTLYVTVAGDDLAGRLTISEPGHADRYPGNNELVWDG